MKIQEVFSIELNKEEFLNLLKTILNLESSNEEEKQIKNTFEQLIKTDNKILFCEGCETNKDVEIVIDPITKRKTPLCRDCLGHRSFYE